MCHFEAEIASAQDKDKIAFRGPSRFSVRPKDAFLYELVFSPASEEKFEVSLSVGLISIKKHILAFGL